MTTTFFCIETGNSLYGGTVRHFFNSPAAVMSFLKATREGWSLRAAEWDDGELVPTRPITNCQFIDEDGGIDAVLEGGRMNFDIWKRLWAVLLNFNFWSRPWLAALIVALCFLLTGYFERQDRELFEQMTPLVMEAGQ